MSEVNRFGKKILIKKILLIVLLLLVYHNVVILLLAPGIYLNVFTLVTMIIYYIAVSVDTIIRPVPEKRKRTWMEGFVAIASFAQPFLFVLAFYENLFLISRFVVLWNLPIVGIIGVALVSLGQIITLGSRIQLGMSGTPVLYTSKEQQLTKTGLYKYVRHPLYLGAILTLIGIYMAFRSLIVFAIMLVLYLVFLVKRMAIEEKMMEEAFGEQYRSYMKQTKRILPFVY